MSDIHAVTMPKWGIEMTEGTVNALSAREGQSIAKGDALLEVETEKIVNTVESPASGTLRRYLVGPGDVKPVGSLVAVLADAAVSDAEVSAFIDQFRGASVSFEPDAAAPAAADAASAPTAPTPEQLVSPVAAKLAESLGVDITKVVGTGRNGRVMKEDVEAHAARSAGSGTAANPATRARLSAARLTIARRLLESKQQIPHYRLVREIDAGALVMHRAAAKDQGSTASLNDYLVHACAAALVRHPALNAQLEGEELLTYPHADIAIAVATPAGLLTPIVRSADTLSLAELSGQAADLAARARAGTLRREEITGGTFTVSNLGMYGLDRFDAIINPPQVAILAVGALRERVVARAGSAVVAPTLVLTLSCDHRVVDGAAGAQFLNALTELLEHPGSG